MRPSNRAIRSRRSLIDELVFHPDPITATRTASKVTV